MPIQSKPDFVYSSEDQRQWAIDTLSTHGDGTVRTGRNFAEAVKRAASLSPNGDVDVLEPSEFELLKKEVRQYTGNKPGMNFSGLPERIEAFRPTWAPVVTPVRASVSPIPGYADAVAIAISLGKSA